MAVNRFPFTKQYRDLLHRRVDSFSDQRRMSDKLVSAAVAITVYAHNNTCAVIVTRRSPRLNAHSGQWALPGGRVDEGESLIDAARREMHEEINLDLPESALLGTLDDYVTRSGYAITPVVFWSDAKAEQLRPNPDEVASIHPFSFNDLVNPKVSQSGKHTGKRQTGAFHELRARSNFCPHRRHALSIQGSRDTEQAHPGWPLRSTGLRLAIT